MDRRASRGSDGGKGGMSCMFMQMPFIDILKGRFLAILLLSLTAHIISNFSIMWSEYLDIHVARALHKSACQACRTPPICAPASRVSFLNLLCFTSFTVFMFNLGIITTCFNVSVYRDSGGVCIMKYTRFYFLHHLPID